MRKKIYTGRYTTENDQDIVVFLIGMRLNKRLAIHKWGPVFMAMPGMIRELYENQEELGFISMESYFGLRATVMIQYWRSTEDLISYAKEQKHLTAWRNFNKKFSTTMLWVFITKPTKLKKGVMNLFTETCLYMV